MKFIGKLNQRVSSLFRSRWINKYSVAAFLFFTWLMFFDKHNLITQWKLRQTVSELEESKKEFDQLLVTAMREREHLEKNKEKFAREKYFMHKPGEDVFIIEQEK
jgi:cell division protein FtsB